MLVEDSRLSVKTIKGIIVTAYKETLAAKP